MEIVNVINLFEKSQVYEKAHSACHGYMYEPNVPKKLLEQSKKK